MKLSLGTVLRDGKLGQPAVAHTFQAYRSANEMKALLINLGREVERFQRMSRISRAMGVPFVRVDAIDPGTADGKRYISSSGLDLSRCRLRAPELGCFLSHHLCWRLIAEGDEPVGLVLEDDLCLASNFGEILAAPDLLTEHTDILRLEGQWGKAVVDLEKRPVAHGYASYRLRSGASASGCYALSRKAAQELVQRVRSVEKPVDLTLFGDALPQEMTIETLVPAACMQYKDMILGNPCAAPPWSGFPDVAFLRSSLGHIAEPHKTGNRVQREARRFWTRLKVRLQGSRRIGLLPHPIGPWPE